MAEVIVVPSSSGEGSYEIEVKQSVNGVQLICNCPAGQFGKSCKHKLKILNVALGIDNGAELAGNISGVGKLVAASRLPALVKELVESERVLEAAKTVVNKAKKNLERHMFIGA